MLLTTTNKLLSGMPRWWSKHVGEAGERRKGMIFEVFGQITSQLCCVGSVEVPKALSLVKQANALTEIKPSNHVDLNAYLACPDVHPRVVLPTVLSCLR